MNTHDKADEGKALNMAVVAALPALEFVSQDLKTASLTEALKETHVFRADGAKLAFQLRDALAMVEMSRERGNMKAAWMHYRFVGEILSKIEAESK